MDTFQPLRLLRYINEEFSIFDSHLVEIESYDIISYTWGSLIDPYICDIPGVNWNVKISKEKLKDIKRLMVSTGVQYLWVDCICINQEDDKEKAAEMSRMFQYYKRAYRCHILIDMPEVWDPQKIVDNLKFMDHIRSHMGGAALAADAPNLTENAMKRLTAWTEAKWTFPVPQSTVRSAGINLGVLNCYATSIHHVRSLFRNLYFSRMWTFQEMILGKNILMWAISPESISCIGELHTWMDLATDSKDKAVKLQKWIETSRELKTGAVNTILRVIEEDKLSLTTLQLQVMGINCARSDIINGGPGWWYENHKGVSNIFSAASITSRTCRERGDIFIGLLGIFSGLFTAEEIERDMSGDDMERISFNFFKQLSTKTTFAWTKLAISSGERKEWDWIPVVANYPGTMTTDIFAGVVRLGRLKPKGQAKADAIVNLKGVPRKYMKIKLNQVSQENTGFHFSFKGCNCGQKVKTGIFSSEQIPTYDQPKIIVKDETGKILVQCATILGSILDPGGNVVHYKRRLLRKLRPKWYVSDHSAKPVNWEDKCVSGTFWENPDPLYIRPHNESMNFRMNDVYECGSRLANNSTAFITCEVRINCGCTIVAPFSFIFEALTAVEGSALGGTSAYIDQDNRIALRDGLGLVQIGDVGKTFNLIAFGGDVKAHKSYASLCKSTKKDKAVVPKLPWPTGRALVKEEFTHGLADKMRNYGYVLTGGIGNLLISRNHLMDPYKILGVCIDEKIANEKGQREVTIR
ncbi:heterokaryon incompatibility protein-domain-containing protein [Pyrenochaeta sp. MPI-SDFR-AT-0127]|nr:heterokaryon incompatibility protein-domain-containing protein [Pyrenochaeta sp. MPI-SDFR-AT-0127]